MSPSLRGGLWLMGAALSFTLMTAFIREAAQHIHPFEIAFVRVVVNLVLLLPFLLKTGRGIFRSENHKAYLFRGCLGFIFLISYFQGAALVPVSDSQALIFTSPLFAALLAVLFLGEKVHAHRTSALAVGFCGALIILRPGFDTVNVGALLVLVAALMNAASNIVVRHTTRTDHPDKVVFYLMAWTLPLISIPAFFVWKTPDLEQLLLMVGVGVFATFNQRCLSRAFAIAEATAILPFDFTRLIFATLVGWLAFSEIPDLWVWVGGAVIFGASVYITRREAKIAPNSHAP